MTYDEMLKLVVDKGIYRLTQDEALQDAKKAGHVPVQKAPSTQYSCVVSLPGYECTRCGGVLSELKNGEIDTIYGGSMMYGRCPAGLKK